MLEPEDEATLRALLRAEGDTTVEASELTWADEIIRRDLEQGMERGLEQGLLRVLGRRFGALPDTVTARIGAIHDPTKVEAPIDAAIAATAPDGFIRALDHRAAILFSQTICTRGVRSDGGVPSASPEQMTRGVKLHCSTSSRNSSGVYSRHSNVSPA